MGISMYSWEVRARSELGEGCVYGIPVFEGYRFSVGWDGQVHMAWRQGLPGL